MSCIEVRIYPQNQFKNLFLKNAHKIVSVLNFESIQKNRILPQIIYVSHQGFLSTCMRVYTVVGVGGWVEQSTFN